jgi:hypothetical protein
MDLSDEGRNSDVKGNIIQYNAIKLVMKESIGIGQNSCGSNPHMMHPVVCLWDRLHNN